MPSGGKRNGSGRPVGSVSAAAAERIIQRKENMRIIQRAKLLLEHDPVAQAEFRKILPPDHADRKLAKDILWDFASLFAGLAAHYQPWPERRGVNPNMDITKFKEYASISIEAAKGAAPYQSPRYSAMVVGASVTNTITVEGGLPDNEVVEHAS